MSVKEIKQEIAALPAAEQQEITAFLFHLRHASDPDDQATLQRRMDDKDPSHWLPLDEFEKRLNQN